MKNVVYKISLDIYEHGSQAVLKAKKTDTGRKLYITLRAGGAQYIIEDDCYAVFKATKPDGSILYNACTIENNEIIYEFTEQTCTAVGRCRCEIALYGLDDKLITSPKFALLVDGTIYPDETVESTDEFSALTKLTTDAMEAISAATQAVDSTNDAIKKATQAAEDAARAGKALIVTSKAEVVNSVGRIVASHNSDQIYEHISNGGAAYLEENGQYIPYSYSTTYNGLRTVVFAYFNFLGFGTFYSVEGDGELHPAYMHAATQKEVIASEKSIIDRLCPTFRESGVAVRCEPVEGHPMSVVAEEGATTISRCGKNLIDYTEAAPRATGHVVNIIENGVRWESGNYFFRIPCDIKAGTTVVFSCVDEAGKLGDAMLYNTDIGGSCSASTAIGKAMTATADANYIYIYSKYGATMIPSPIVVTNLQLECGSAATAYEPYKEVETFAPGETVPALSGVNTIWADSGEITVTGRADPVTIINNLADQIDALSKTVSTLLEG